MLIQHVVNSHKREFYIKFVWAQLERAVIFYAKRMDEPTHDNVLHPNSHRLLDMRDDILRCWDIGKKPLITAAFKILTVKYEHSPAYRNLLDFAVMLIDKYGWKPFNPNRQMRGWLGE